MTKKGKKALLVGGGLLAAYPLVLIALGYLLVGSVEDRVRERLEFTLRASEVSIQEVNVSLLRGQVQVKGVHAERQGVGTASVRIASLTIDVPPMGWALIQSTPSRLQLAGAHLKLSAVGAATLRKGESEPLHLQEFTISDSSVQLVATSLFPSLGKVEFAIERGHAKDVQLNDAMSWLYQTDELVASLNAPGEVEMGLSYIQEEMTLHGSVLGSRTITVPFVWPVPDPRDLELSQMLELGTQLAKIVAKEYAKDKAKAVFDNVLEVIE